MYAVQGSTHSVSESQYRPIIYAPLPPRPAGDPNSIPESVFRNPNSQSSRAWRLAHPDLADALPPQAPRPAQPHTLPPSTTQPTFSFNSAKTQDDSPVMGVISSQCQSAPVKKKQILQTIPEDMLGGGKRSTLPTVAALIAAAASSAEGGSASAGHRQDDRHDDTMDESEGGQDEDIDHSGGQGGGASGGGEPGGGDDDDPDKVIMNDINDRSDSRSTIIHIGKIDI